MRPYPKFKDSGVSWIGRIPQDWTVSKFKYISELYTGNSLNDNQKSYYESNDPDHLPYISSKDIDVNYQTVNYDNGIRIPRDEPSFKTSPKDSFLMVIEGGSSGRKMVFLNQKVCFVNKLCSFNSSDNTKYLFYFVQSKNYQDKFKLSLSGLIGGVSVSVLRNIEVPRPKISEQTSIVSFLDSKTQKIDQLIEITEKKIELLNEKRTSLINHCVTKGLNPNVEMKDSGVNGIGKIPLHWEIGMVKRFTTDHRQGYYSTEPYTESGLKVVRITDLLDGNRIDVSDSPYYILSEEDEERFILRKGDFLFQRTGSHKKIGVFYSDEPSVYGSFLIRFRFSNRINHKYLLNYFNSISYQDQLNEQIHGGVNPNIHVENIKVCYIPIPPQNEQEDIVHYLEDNTSQIESEIQYGITKVDLLKEYRQSLISEVVTGKIDVREWKE